MRIDYYSNNELLYRAWAAWVYSCYQFQGPVWLVTTKNLKSKYNIDIIEDDNRVYFEGAAEDLMRFILEWS